MQNTLAKIIEPAQVNTYMNKGMALLFVLRSILLTQRVFRPATSAMPADGDAGSYQADLQAVAAKSPLGPFDSTAVSIQERFPGESGRRLQDLVWMTYVTWL